MELDALLRASRSEPSEELVSRLRSRIESARTTTRAFPRVALAGATTAVLVAGLGAVGGVSYAASSVAGLVRSAHVDLGTKLTVASQQSSAADAQYGGEDVSNNQQQQQGQQGQQGSVQVKQNGQGQQGGQQQTVVTVQWSPQTFTQPVIVHVDPTPPKVTSTALVGGGNQLVSIVVTDAKGQPVTTLAAPIDITFTNPAKNFVPVISQDGVNFRAVHKLDGTTLLDSDQDGYFIDSAGTVHILTRHLTVFAVLYSANVNVSESGKKTPQAGSGLFGDPTRNHVGAPALAQVSTTIKPIKRMIGTFVPFTFSVDEQATMSISIFDAKGHAMTIDANGTRVRGSKQTGTAAASLPLSILRPGQIRTLLKVPSGLLMPGKTYKLRLVATDFDGHKVVKYATFKA